MEDGLSAMAGMKKGFDLVGWLQSRDLFAYLRLKSCNDNE